MGEHIPHIGDVGDIPRFHVAVEEDGFVKHISHVGNARDIPITEIVIE